MAVAINKRHLSINQSINQSIDQHSEQIGGLFTYFHLSCDKNLQTMQIENTKKNAAEAYQLNIATISTFNK